MCAAVFTAPRLVVRLARSLKPAGHADAVTEGGQLQKRQVETTAVEADQGWPAILFPAPPKIFRNNVRAELRFVQDHHVFQAEIGRHLAHDHRYGQLKTIRDKIALVFLHQLVAMRRTASAGKRLPGITQLGHQFGVGDAFSIEDQVTDRGGHD